MEKTKNIFLGKKILIYGLGKSGISSYRFLKNKAKVYLFDDNQKINFKLNKKLINLNEISKINFDKIQIDYIYLKKFNLILMKFISIKLILFKPNLIPNLTSLSLAQLSPSLFSTTS